MSSSLTQCIERRALLKYLVVSQLKLGRKDMMLGYLWWILDPLLLMLVYYFLVMVAFKSRIERYPLFILCGLIPFRAFAVSITGALTSISSKRSLISQINFPRLFLPMTEVVTNHIKLGFGFIVLAAVGMMYGIWPSFSLLLLVVPYVLQVALVAGLACVLAVVGTYFADMRNLIALFIRILLFMSPILYPLTRIPPAYRGIYLMNPFASLVTTYRDIICQRGIDPALLGTLALQSLGILIIGYALFLKFDKKMLKQL